MRGTRSQGAVIIPSALSLSEGRGHTPSSQVEDTKSLGGERAARLLGLTAGDGDDDTPQLAGGFDGGTAAAASAASGHGTRT